MAQVGAPGAESLWQIRTENRYHNNRRAETSRPQYLSPRVQQPVAPLEGATSGHYCVMEELYDTCWGIVVYRLRGNVKDFVDQGRERARSCTSVARNAVQPASALAVFLICPRPSGYCAAGLGGRYLPFTALAAAQKIGRPRAEARNRTDLRRIAFVHPSLNTEI
ncbi:hypothetical protein N656DRAFT_505769 [Canariomyces notabilis]|uniref:Uncharacterized protein n=1 Tax=Canariomyces notabilis TaxID=2074819 RepID=A0AAN6T7V1_9PEZI|nr:hypothetical protein N656DRAFT_505769 [Canariomyces arenarius]